MIDAPQVVYVADDLPRHSTGRYPHRQQIARLVIHHSAAPARVGARAIAAYHVRHGWPGIGYHYVILPDGTIQQTNALYLASWHAAGHNRASVGVCLLGNFMRCEPPAAQLEAAARLCAWLADVHGLEPSAVAGHREINKTACPGRTWPHWKPALLQGIDAWRKTD